MAPPLLDEVIILVQAAAEFPDVLKPTFEARDLEASASSIAVIDPEGKILWLNPAWHRFGRENGLGDRAGAYVSYWDGVSEPLRALYRSALDEALREDRVFEQDYECSSADVRRVFRLRAIPVDGRALILEHSLIEESPHDEAASEPILERYLDEAGLVRQCSYCRRVRAPGTATWHWVPSLVDRPHPRTSHGICETCFGFHWGSRDRG